MPSTLLGLPLHPLVVHAVVVLVPLAGLLALGSAVNARFRQWARWATPAVAIVATLLVPIATASGENLQGRLGPTILIQQHAELGDTLLPLMGVLTLLVLVMWWFQRRGTRGVLGIVVAVAVALASVGTLVQVVRIGHSGAKAVWSNTPTGGGSGGGDHG